MKHQFFSFSIILTFFLNKTFLGVNYTRNFLQNTKGRSPKSFITSGPGLQSETSIENVEVTLHVRLKQSDFEI
jgi:hypothetical protein